MYYQNYEDYMRTVLGYPIQQQNNQNTYQPADMYSYDPTIQAPIQVNNQELENLYPDIYKIINPMICKICDENRNKPITAELIEQMTKEIYSNVEVDEQLNVNIKAEVNLQSKSNTQNRSDNRQVSKKPGNYLLNDLIKILILKNLLGNPIKPLRPPRPPFPVGPGFPLPRQGYFN